MIDSSEVKISVLKELMEKMRNLEGEKMRPKAVEVSMASMKPEDGEGSPEEEKLDLSEPDHSSSQDHDAHTAVDHDAQGDGKSGDELSPEDMAMLEELLGGDDDKKFEG